MLFNYDIKYDTIENLDENFTFNLSLFLEIILKNGILEENNIFIPLV
jgi:hypothetical protein